MTDKDYLPLSKSHLYESSNCIYEYEDRNLDVAQAQAAALIAIAERLDKLIVAIQESGGSYGSGRPTRQMP